MSPIRHPASSRTSPLAVALLVTCLAAVPGPTHSASAEGGETPPETEEIRIYGRRPGAETVIGLDPRTAPAAAPDTAQLMRRVPGGDVAGNGPLSGQLQYRGLFGPRIHVRVDGAFVSSGGPNRMDPPLIYAPRPLLESLEVERGIASVRSGPESIGGSVRARLKRSRFAESDSFEYHHDVEVLGRSADESVAGGGLVAVANRTHRLHALGSREHGNDVSTDEGGIHPTRHERSAYGGGYGLRLGDHELGVDYRHIDVDDTGTPALPMDIPWFDTELLSVDYEGRAGGFGLSARVYGSDIDHRMDNFTLRAPPGSAAAFRFVDATSDDLGWRLEATRGLWGGDVAVGADGHRTRHDMDIFNPNNPAFYVEQFDDARKDRYGVFAEWTGNPMARLEVELGLRYTRVETDADAVAAPAAVMALRDAFNAADRDRGDDLVDAVLRLAAQVTDSLRLEVAAGRKTRAPSSIERYLWLPLEVSAGLADGNNYVGDIDLDPEVSHEVDGGFSWSGEWLTLAPRAFYKRVDDYIQGVPATDPAVIAVSTANGDPTPLRFANVNAELYGLDAEWALRLPHGFQLDGIVSWVRGRRRDVDDDLFRIAPLRSRATLSYRAETWTAALEGVFTARQTHVSATNGESETGSHAFLNLLFGWEPREGLGLTVGVENVTDELYRDHLSGINRVVNSGVPPGLKIPGAGRSFFGRATWRW